MRRAISCACRSWVGDHAGTGDDGDLRSRLRIRHGTKVAHDTSVEVHLIAHRPGLFGGESSVIEDALLLSIVTGSAGRRAFILA